MIVLALLILVTLAGYIGYLIGYDTADSQRRPCPYCHIRQQTVAAEMQLQQLTHAAMSQMLDTARRAQAERRDELP